MPISPGELNLRANAVKLSRLHLQDKAFGMDQEYLEFAIDLAARKSADGRHGPFAAVVVRQDRIVGEGWNQVTELNDPSAHGEIMAIRAAGRNLGTHDLSGCTLYASCEPCPMCLAAIYWARIDRLRYACGMEDAAAAGFDDAAILRELRLPWSRRALPVHQAAREAGLRVFEAWLKNPRRQEY